MDCDACSALSRILGARAVPDECSDDPRALPDVSPPGVAKATFVRLLRRTGLMAAAPAEEEPPEEGGCTADAGVRPACPARLDGSPDNELSLPALPAPLRDESATDGVLLFLGRPAVLFLLRGLPPERLSPDIARVHCALLLPSLLLPPLLLDIPRLRKR